MTTKIAAREVTPIENPGDILDAGNGDGSSEPNVLVQIAQAIAAYPATFVELEFIDVDPASGDTLNAGEEADLQLRVSRRRPADDAGNTDQDRRRERHDGEEQRRCGTIRGATP